MYFRDLKVWQQAHALELEIFKITKRFPKREQSALTLKLQQVAMSIPANIAKGFDKKSNREFSTLLDEAASSLTETRDYIILAKDLRYIKDAQLKRLNLICNEVENFISDLQSRLKTQLEQSEKLNR